MYKIVYTDNPYSHVRPFDNNIYLGITSQMDEDEIQATIQHEIGHKKHRHPEKNILNLLFGKRIRHHKREAMADIYAIKMCGFVSVLKMLQGRLMSGALSYEQYVDRLFYIYKHGA